MITRTTLALSLLLPPSLAAAAADANEPAAKPLVEQVRQAIGKGVDFLRVQERGVGDWEVDTESQARPGGWTSLAMLALLNSGVKPDDPIIDRGLRYLRTIAPENTYVVGLQTMVFTAAGRDEDRGRVQRNVDWLLRTCCRDDNRQVTGWSYNQSATWGPDNSNTQYALLGLHEGHLAGAKIEPERWKEIQDFYVRSQRIDGRGDGGWGYARHGIEGTTLTMTTAGLCGLLITGMELNQGRERIGADGVASNCGVYQENRPVSQALAWIGRHYTIDFPQAPFYNLYGLERAGRLTGERFLGDHDWYREGCEWLVKRQRDDGSWQGTRGHDSWRVVATSFALLFLSKGRTPILISKLVHGPGDDWNNDHNDARNLVEYVSKNLFQRQPLAWQIFDAKLKENNHDALLALTGELLQSPIVYFNGHRAPRFTDTQVDLLREYVEQGGFIFAEACCSQPAFDRGFRELVQRLFPDTPLKPLDPGHPIWQSYARVPPGSFRLEGIEQGCKTVLVYAPQDLSCLWEANDASTGKGQLAFRLGANIIAYATGLELPRPRLSVPLVIRDDAEGQRVPRGYLKVVQLRHEGDWQPAPKAMRNLMTHLQDQPRLPVAIKTEALYPSQDSLFDYKFLYLHGRHAFSFDPKARANLRANLDAGALLFADACCGKQAFDTSFRELMSQLFPDKKLELIPLSDELYSKELNGTAIRTVRCRRHRAEETGTGGGFEEVEPALEGIKLNNRWVVIYSKYDIGCALERHQSSDCLGHDYASALRLAGAAVLYALNR